MARTSRCMLIAVLIFPFLTQSLLFGQVEKAIPEKVHYVRKVGVMPKDWYIRQAELWKNVIDENSKNGEAWRNYYLATEYSFWHTDIPTEERNATLNQILSEMEVAVLGKAIPDLFRHHAAEFEKNNWGKIVADNVGKLFPGLFEYLILKYRNGDYSISLLEIASLLRPDAAEVYYDFIVYYEWHHPDREKAKEYCEKLYKSRDMATGLINYNHNVLISTAKNAILFTNGDNDTFPIWMLQHAKGIRKDVTVLNLHLIRKRAYLERLLKEKNAKINWRKIPDAKDGNFIPKLCETLDAANPNMPIYFALTVNKSYTKPLAKNLYVVGLAAQYSAKRLDNLALLRKNVEKSFRLDYLKYDWYSEMHISNRSIIEGPNLNYATPFIMLSEYYETVGENEKADDWRDFALDIAEQANDRKLIQHIKNRK